MLGGTAPRGFGMDVPIVLEVRVDEVEFWEVVCRFWYFWWIFGWLFVDLGIFGG